ncbi:hypothetical protein [Vibrio owensii]|uniref:hypothetical protein n=1 Tax=Vibrio owensii TaxID=696485 RepID=UPI0022DE44B2|nr:hypothetical protein [Vibrio owensii]MDA0385229.1 hypothetical protein [Vibrio owensii]
MKGIVLYILVVALISGCSTSTLTPNYNDDLDNAKVIYDECALMKDVNCEESMEEEV